MITYKIKKVLPDEILSEMGRLNKINIFAVFVVLGVILLLTGCRKKSERSSVSFSKKTVVHHENKVIKDCDYTFQEAVAGCNAPSRILNELELINVRYYSTDGKIHEGQLLTNKNIAGDLKDIFDSVLRYKFPVKQVVPVVKYGWDDDLSMADNNTYSFCYRNVDFSKHAYGMAVDINPFFNPVRWKYPYSLHHANKPGGAVRDTTRNGTFYAGHPLVELFRKKGFRWGHTFTQKFDDHHFEKRNRYIY